MDKKIVVADNALFYLRGFSRLYDGVLQARDFREAMGFRGEEGIGLLVTELVDARSPVSAEELISAYRKKSIPVIVYTNDSFETARKKVEKLNAKGLNIAVLAGKGGRDNQIQKYLGTHIDILLENPESYEGNTQFVQNLLKKEKEIPPSGENGGMDPARTYWGRRKIRTFFWRR